VPRSPWKYFEWLPPLQIFSLSHACLPNFRTRIRSRPWRDNRLQRLIFWPLGPSRPYRPISSFQEIQGLKRSLLSLPSFFFDVFFFRFTAVRLQTSELPRPFLLRWHQQCPRAASACFRPFFFFLAFFWAQFFSEIRPQRFSFLPLMDLFYFLRPGLHTLWLCLDPSADFLIGFPFVGPSPD